MLKLICDEFEELKTIAGLIGDPNYKEINSRGKSIKRRFTKVQGWFSKLRVDFKKNSVDKHSDKSVQ
jgi:hypothetical protein